jgi:hypothetical protein
MEILQIKEQLRLLINKNSLENVSNTPDYVLAEYLFEALSHFNHLVNTSNEAKTTEAKIKIKEYYLDRMIQSAQNAIDSRCAWYDNKDSSIIENT